MPQMRFKNRSLQSGDFRTPVSFYSYVNDGPYPDDVEEKLLYKCFAETYSPSIKDREILDVNSAKQGLTIVIRDPYQTFTPNNKHVVLVDDFRLDVKTFNIYDVRLDTPGKGFITIALGEK
ncbi:hypothetical protein ACFY3K_00595 [Staphylococcus capitis]|uniref:hypothetical protein n=1 Tax=Staphylococcus capitis TaxID=29388 RepID=UPI0036846861